MCYRCFEYVTVFMWLCERTFVCVIMSLPDVDPCLLPEYTIMAESLDRCFSRAILKHIPSEDCDTDEEFHINREDKERKDKKRNRGSKSLGPESLIKATEQVQRKRNSQGGKGTTPSEEEEYKLTRPPPPPHWANGPPHPHSLPPSRQRIHEGDMRGLYHPGQQVLTAQLCFLKFELISH